MLEMRNGLEKSCEDFREKFDAIQKQKIDALDLDKPRPSNARHPFFNYHSWSIGILLLSLNIKYESKPIICYTNSHKFYIKNF